MDAMDVKAFYIFICMSSAASNSDGEFILTYKQSSHKAAISTELSPTTFTQPAASFCDLFWNHLIFCILLTGIFYAKTRESNLPVNVQIFNQFLAFAVSLSSHFTYWRLFLQCLLYMHILISLYFSYQFFLNATLAWVLDVELHVSALPSSYFFVKN